MRSAYGWFWCLVYRFGYCFLIPKNLYAHGGIFSEVFGEALKERESYLVSRISKKGFEAYKIMRVLDTRYEQRDTRHEGRLKWISKL